jgi:wyosine [tRNA(Phe)-imidazoG37] synthetase (radical SAM superfamily)
VFYDPATVLREIEERILKVEQNRESIDYLTFVPDGEPTLDSRLGDEIQSLRRLGLKVAVITNSSLLGRQDVREELRKADWVSLKVDASQLGVWYRINRPHPGLQLRTILEGILEFAKGFKGQLVTETMLVKDVNDGEENLRKTADFLASLNPSKAYLSIPTRPPTEKWVRPAEEAGINQAFQIFSEKVDSVECLIDYEGNAFTSTGNVEEDLLSITAVHPMREDAVKEFLAESEADWAVVRRLLAQGVLSETTYRGKHFFLKSLPGGSWKSS